MEYQYSGGTFTSENGWNRLSAVQELGNSETSVMSQKAVSNGIYKGQLQKAMTVREIPFISLDQGSGSNYELYPNDSATSNWMGVILRPLRNTKYRYSSWNYGSSYIRYYKGDVDTSAQCVYADTTIMWSRGAFTTPDMDFDFAVINIQRNQNDYTEFYPIEYLYFFSIDTNDIEDAAVTTNKIADNAVTTNKIADKSITALKSNHAALFEYCITAGINLLPNATFTDLSADEDAFSVGLLKNNGEVDTAQTNYRTSKFVDYNTSYEHAYSFLYTDFGTEQYSNNYASICFYTKTDHTFVTSFVVASGKQMVLIPNGYSVRVSFKATTPILKVGYNPAQLKHLQNDVDTLQNDVDTLQNDVDTLQDGSETTEQEDSLSVTLSSDNTEYDNEHIWDNTGSETEGGNYGTLRYIIPFGAVEVNLSNYNVGVYNGGFFTKEGTWITGINNSVDTMSAVQIPANAYYIDISVWNSDPYKTITFKLELIKYTLPNLIIKKEQISDLTVDNNQWAGKKLCIVGTSVAYGSNAEKAYAKIASKRLGFEIIPAGVPGQAIHAYIDNEHGSVLAPLTYGSTCLSKAEYEAAKMAGATNITISTTPKPTDGENWSPGDDSNYNSYYRTWENIFTENAGVSLWIFATGPNNSNFALDDWNAFNKNNWKYNDDSPFSDHRTTFLGAMLYLMDKMYALGNDQRMVLVIDSSFNYTQTKSAFELLHNQWNIPMIDLWGKINTSPKSLLAIKSKNGTDEHPSTFGQERLGDIFTNELLLIS